MEYVVISDKELTVGIGKGYLKRIGKWMFVDLKVPSFEKWVETKMSLSEFRELDKNKKRELFLRWKHGHKSNELNEDVEATDKETFYTLWNMSAETVENLSDEDRAYRNSRISWMAYCNKTWDEISGNI